MLPLMAVIILPPPDGPPPLLTEAEVAAALRVTDRTVRSWDAKGIVHAIRIGGVKRYRASDIASLMEPTTSEAPAGNQGFAKTDVVSSDGAPRA